MNSQYSWVIVAAGAFVGCVTIGSIFSLPVFVQPRSLTTGWSRTGISSAMTIDFIAISAASFGWGMIMDRFGPRVVLLSGSLLLGLGLLLASRASSVLEFQLVFGCLVGAGGCAIFASLTATVMGWFDRQRSLTVSLVSAGMNVAAMTVAPLAAKFVTIYDRRTAQSLIAIMVWALLLPAAFAIRRSLARAGAARGAAGLHPIARTALRSPQFIVLALTYFRCCATYSGPLLHTLSYAIACGLTVMFAVTIVIVEGLAGLAGRVVFGSLRVRFVP